MKKNLFLFTFSIFLFFSIVPAIFASETDDIDLKLAPYLDVVNELNEEIGSKWVIKEDMKEAVYESVKDKTPDEVKEMLKGWYYDANIQGAKSIRTISKNLLLFAMQISMFLIII